MRLIRITLSHIKSVWRQDLAHFADSVARLLSSVSFSLSFLFSLNLLLKRADNIAGYTSNQVLFLVLLSQSVYFLLDSTILNSIDKFQFDAHKGTLDYALIRPIGVKTYLLIRSISVLGLLKGMPILAMYALPINWGQLNLSMQNLIMGLVVLFVSYCTIAALMLTWATKTILIPSPKNALIAQYYSLVGAGRELPDSLFKPAQSIIYSSLVPLLGGVTFSGAVMLGKISFTQGLVVALSAFTVNALICNFFWRLAMLKYNSASS
jgi:ABC-type uncharacterized transport system permease subunit